MTPRQLALCAAPLALIIATAACWNFLTSGRISISVLFFFAALAFVCVAAGDLLVVRLLGASSRFDSFSIRLLFGFLAINAVLYILILVLPLDITFSASLIAAVVLFAWWKDRESNAHQALPVSSHLEIAFLLISLVAITFWCQDLFHPVIAGPAETTIRAWPDVFFHVRQISALALSRGADTLSDFQMAGAPANAYHNAGYVLPASLMAITPTTSLQAYCGTFVPFGMLLTALASFSLLTSLIGKWPGAAAGLALLLVPDALQQGFGNGFLSYHWLQQVGPAGLYGVAVAALAWLLMFEACRERDWRLLLMAYFVALGIVMFKAQLFVANAYLILVFPAFFMAGLTRNMRRIYFLFATGLFFLTVFLSQQSENVPVMRLDGTGIELYGASLVSAQSHGVFYPFVAYVFQSAGGIFFVLATSVILLFGTFGLWTIIFPLIGSHLKQRLALSTVIFPALVVIVYLVMSQGLALDSNLIGRPEELLNRPSVWAYFVVCSWGGAGLYFLLFGAERPKVKSSFLAVMAVAIAGVGIPVHFGHNVHSLAQWLPNVDGVRIPTCLAMSASYIRENSNRTDLIQDSSNDKDFSFTALSERQAFAIDARGIRAPEGVRARLDQLHFGLKKFETENEVLNFVSQNAISWYLRRPGDIVNWPDNLDHYVKYRCADYRVYGFKPAPGQHAPG